MDAVGNQFFAGRQSDGSSGPEDLIIQAVRNIDGARGSQSNDAGSTQIEIAVMRRHHRIPGDSLPELLGAFDASWNL